MGIGADETHVTQVVGKEMFQLYRSLPNPKQSNIYSFMISGGIVGLGTLGTPMIIRGFETMAQLFNLNGL